MTSEALNLGAVVVVDEFKKRKLPLKRHRHGLPLMRIFKRQRHTSGDEHQRVLFGRELADLCVNGKPCPPIMVSAIQSSFIRETHFIEFAYCDPCYRSVVCLSVTFVQCAQTAEDTDTISFVYTTAPYLSQIALKFGYRRSTPSSPNITPKWPTPYRRGTQQSCWSCALLLVLLCFLYYPQHLMALKWSFMRSYAFQKQLVYSSSSVLSRKPGQFIT